MSSIYWTCSCASSNLRWLVRRNASTTSFDSSSFSSCWSVECGRECGVWSVECGCGVWVWSVGGWSVGVECGEWRVVCGCECGVRVWLCCTCTRFTAQSGREAMSHNNWRVYDSWADEETVYRPGRSGRSALTVHMKWKLGGSGSFGSHSVSSSESQLIRLW
jgi:hypothetical protein